MQKLKKIAGEGDMLYKKKKKKETITTTPLLLPAQGAIVRTSKKFHSLFCTERWPLHQI